MQDQLPSPPQSQCWQLVVAGKLSTRAGAGLAGSEFEPCAAVFHRRMVFQNRLLEALPGRRLATGFSMLHSVERIDEHEKTERVEHCDFASLQQSTLEFLLRMLLLLFFALLRFFPGEFHLVRNKLLQRASQRAGVIGSASAAIAASAEDERRTA